MIPQARRLVALLTPATREALEAAAQAALRETHATVEPEHVLRELCRDTRTDAGTLLAGQATLATGLSAALDAAIARFPRGHARLPAFSTDLLRLLADAWLLASVDLGLRQCGSLPLLAAVAAEPARRAALTAGVPPLEALLAHPALRDLPQTLASSREMPQAAGGGRGDGSALASYTRDLTTAARDGRLDGAIGREREIRQLIDVLMRRQQNNPLLAGPAGVGKTAIVEGLACAIAAGEVPPRLADLSLRSLDLGALQAGSGLRGEFEQRLRAVLEEAAATVPPTVLFIDEAHMLVGAGGAAGQGDAANLLKPALARGGNGVIAATTWGDYKRVIEKDPALARRFQVIRVAEPGEADAVAMLRVLAPKLEAHHGVPIEEAALREAVRLSHRFVTARHLPEKAIAALDTACARVAIARATPPEELLAAEREATALAAELARMRRDAAGGPEAAERIEALEDARQRAEEVRLHLGGQWQLEQEAIARLAELEVSLAEAADDALRSEWAGLRLELEEVRRARGAASLAVDGRAVAEVIAGWTGIPAGRMLADQRIDARALQARLAERIVGQDAALDAICRRIQTFFADLGEPDKPMGVFLLCGPSGVGKTETALALADLLFGNARALITVNMTEYQEAHSVSGLRGAPPGYVGYGRGGVLTEAVRRQPYAVVLLDEVEKAHPDVLEMFYQVFDRGLLDDSEGQSVDFTNTVILLTSNVGDEALREALQRRPTADAASLAAALRPALQRRFPAAFLGRLVVVPYRPLDRKGIEAVARLKLARIQERFAATHGGELTYDPALLRAIADEAQASESGARRIDAILTHSILPALSSSLLDALAEGRTLAGAHLALGADGRLTIGLRG